MSTKTGVLGVLGIPDFDDEFVQLGTKTKAYLDPITAKRDAGTLTLADVEGAQSQFEEDYSAYKFRLDQYALQGNGEMQIAAGARTALEPYAERWRTTLATEAKRLTPNPLELAAIPTLENILGGETARQRAAKVAEQQKKRSAAGGRLATILGNYKPSEGLTTQPKTLTGY